MCICAQWTGFFAFSKSPATNSFTTAPHSELPSIQSTKALSLKSLFPNTNVMSSQLHVASLPWYHPTFQNMTHYILSINNWVWLTCTHLHTYIRSLSLSFPLMCSEKYVSWNRTHLHFVQSIFPSPHNAHSHLVQQSQTVRLHHSSCMPTQTLPRSWGPGPPCRQSDGVHTRSPSPQTEPCTPWQNARCRYILITVYIQTSVISNNYSKISLIPHPETRGCLYIVYSCWAVVHITWFVWCTHHLDSSRKPFAPTTRLISTWLKPYSGIYKDHLGQFTPYHHLVCNFFGEHHQHH